MTDLQRLVERVKLSEFDTYTAFIEHIASRSILYDTQKHNSDEPIYRYLYYCMSIECPEVVDLRTVVEKHVTTPNHIFNTLALAFKRRYTSYIDDIINNYGEHSVHSSDDEAYTQIEVDYGMMDPVIARDVQHVKGNRYIKGIGPIDSDYSAMYQLKNELLTLLTTRAIKPMTDDINFNLPQDILNSITTEIVQDGKPEGDVSIHVTFNIYSHTTLVQTIPCYLYKPSLLDWEDFYTLIDGFNEQLRIAYLAERECNINNI